MNEFEKERYNKAYDRAAIANPMTTDCPPQWNADGIRDNAIEKETDLVIEAHSSDPSLMMEMILENDYDQDGLKELAQDLCTMMTNNNMDSKLTFAETMMTFIELKAKELAINEVDS